MCTAISLQAGAHFFGRNLDLEYTGGERVVFCPRNFPLPMRRLPDFTRHYAMIGMARVEDGYPLYYDGVNEHGLAIAALSFPRFGVYHPPKEDAKNVASFELIPYLLGACRTLSEARERLLRMCMTDDAFSPALPATPLHFMLSCPEGSLVIESIADGLKLYDNPVGVLTNSPPFSYQLLRLSEHMNLTRGESENRFSDKYDMPVLSRGLGAVGLPGDLSSSSRFARAAFAALNSECREDGLYPISQMFHLLDFAAFPRGCVKLGDLFEITAYSACMDTKKGVYYCRTYENSRILAADMRRENMDADALKAYTLRQEQDILFIN